MAINKNKRISELPELTSATLDTTYVVGISGSTTYKISINKLTSSLDVAFATDLITDALSGSVDGLVTTSSFDSYTASISTASLVVSINNLNSFTSSQSTLNTTFQNGINTRLQTSSFNEFSASIHSELLAATNEQDLSIYVTQLIVGTLSSSVDNRLDSLEGNSGSYLTSLNGAISASSQLTTSYDERYALSGSITQTTWDNIENKPSDIVSSSAQITAFGFISASTSIPAGTISGSSQLTESFDTRYTLSGSITQTTWDNIENKPSGIVSQSTDLSSINAFTQSIENISGSWITKDETGSFATTGSNTFTGNQTISGSIILGGDITTTIIPQVGSTRTIATDSNDGTGAGTPNEVDVVYDNTIIPTYYYPGGGAPVFTDSTITFANGDIRTITSITTESGPYLRIVYSGSATTSSPEFPITLKTGDYVAASATPTNIIVGNKNWSFGADGILTIPGDMVAGNFIQTTNLQGTGSLYLKPDLNDSRDIRIYNTAPSDIHIKGNAAYSFFGDDTNYLKIDDNTNDITINSISNVNIHGSGSLNGYQILTSNNTSSLATTGSNTFVGNQIVSASMYVTGDLIVFGSSSLVNISASVVSIGTNIVKLNTATPAVRFAGLQVIDSGSTQMSSSLYWDSINNHWIYQRESGAVYGGGMLISGPRNLGALGDEVGITNNRVVMGIGGDHISSSGMWTDGNNLSVPNNLEVSGSIKGQILSTNGVISGSSQITAFGFISSSQTINTASLATTGSNSFNGNQTITGSLIVSAVAVVNGGVTIPTGSTITLTSGSSISVDASGAITGSLSGSVFGIGDVVAFSSSVNSKILSGSAIAGTISGSSQLTSSFDTRYLTIGGDGVITGSSQLTSSYDSRYVLSGSVSVLPSGTISGSAQIITLGFLSGSYVSSSYTSSMSVNYALYASNIPVIYEDAFVDLYPVFTRNVASNSYNTLKGNDTSSIRYNTQTHNLYLTSSGAFVGNIQSTNGVISGSSQISALGFVSGSYETTGRGIISSSVQLPSGIISGSSQLTASYDGRYSLSGSTGGNTFASTKITELLYNVQAVIGANTPNATVPDWDCSYTTTAGSTIMFLGSFTAYTAVTGTKTFFLDVDGVGLAAYSYTFTNNGNHQTIPCIFNVEQLSAGTHSIKLRIPSGVIVDSFDYMNLTVIETMASNGVLLDGIPSGTISGSSQLTSSYDSRYTLSGSIGGTPAGTISGSSQLTSSFDGRYTQTASFNTLTASFNSFTASAQSVTTGSNSFNGTQTITGSLIITTGSFIASNILANTSSLYLTSGSNLYIQNNGVVEITGSLGVTGSISLNGTTSTIPTYLYTQKTTGQTVPDSTWTTLSGWAAALYSNNAGEWNATTGVFTTTKAGRYLISATLQMAQAADTPGSEYQVNIHRNASGYAYSRYFPETASNVFKNSIVVNGIVSLVVGDTLTVRAYQSTGGDRFIHTNGNFFTIQQLPSSILV